MTTDDPESETHRTHEDESRSDVPIVLRAAIAAAAAFTVTVVRHACRLLCGSPASESTRVPKSPMDSPLWDQVCPIDLRKAERKLIEERHSRPPKGSGSPEGGPTDEAPLGLALSGGGIRSATFCLGFLQAMSAKRLLGKVDYLSTVSGGGYIGSFLGALFARPELDERAGPDRVSTVMDVLTDPFSKALRWLRENGRYLSPNGAGDLWAALALQMRNWCSVVLVMGLSGLTLFLGVNALRAGLGRSPWARTAIADWFPLPASTGFWWWSPSLALFALALVPAVVLGWASWLIPRSKDGSRAWPQWVVAIALVALSIVLLWANNAALALYRPALWTILTLGVITLAFSLSVVSVVWARSGSPDPEKPSRSELFRVIRVRLTTWLAGALMVLAVLLVFGMLDSLGQSLYLGWQARGLSLTLKALGAATGLASLLSFGQKLTSLSKLLPASARKLPLETIATVAGVFGFGLFLLNLNLLGHAIAWNWALPGPPDAVYLAVLVGAGAAGLVLSWLLGHHVPFLNGSSLQLLYGSRLARAYLGASNPKRHRRDGLAITNLIPGDDIWLDGYRPHARGGPLHLINLTFNETCSAKSQTEQRDRKGLQFAVGPCGLSVGRTDHATWLDSSGGDERPVKEIVPIERSRDGSAFAIFPTPSHGTRSVENISIGHWIALSGAAFGTGTGSQNSLGFSLIAGLTNVRLGYWWDSHVNPRDRTHATPPSFSQQVGRLFTWAFPVQSYLLDEWLARFHGPARRHWYLSDGGHFENTAVYKLIRRRLPHIVCCDCGQDDAYTFTDLSNLVRKARIDFNAEVTLHDRAQLNQLRGTRIPESVFSEIGALDEFAEKKTRKHHALLAVVRYEGRPTPESLILFVKPAVAGNEPADLREYQYSHPAFPNEPTTDQFFDEAQWESYRKLGEHSGQELLSLDRNGDWWFTKIRPEQL